MNLIEAKNLEKSFTQAGKPLPVLSGISQKFEQGKTYAITGASGSGKSTLLHLLGKLDTPTSGKVNLNETKIGFVFQQFNLLLGLTAEENVALPIRFSNVSKGNALKRARELLDLVDLGNRITHKPSELSGGQQQRVAIARALANDPEVVLADEPTGNLDTHSGERVVNVLEKLHNLGKTLVVITHEAYLAERAQRILILKDGKIVKK